MNTKDLKSFLKVCEYKSISKAAQFLYVTPQGLSKSIKNIENELGVELFSRTPQGIVLNEYGKLLEKKASNIIKEMESIFDINDEANNQKETIKLASTYGVLSYLSIDFIREFNKIYPDIIVTTAEFPDSPVENAVWNEIQDIGFIAGPVDAIKFNAIFLKSFKHCLVVEKNNQLAKKEKLSYIDLKDESIILESREFKAYTNNINKFLKHGVNINIVFETSEIDFAHKLASMNKGIAITVDFAAKENHYENTVVIPFEDENNTWDIYMITKKDRPISEAGQTFINYVIEYLKDK
ncbi:LysR family transcriptional regulator [Clostridium beijerinckii]|uniref:HTH-type transcriptional regulator CynR n=1 Tax=Clostridium beijerinckii TaxID=1520 RepID=A0A1S8RVJ9_CLOBE|nr:LysR family transcriptional regulator [Clostridium beijerinckii]NRY63248.1 DNA-binding transcriptional LysR family regulator [Clostridium beijerinckii]OOM57230.1 HTH-type transcriptional regulator CynR [Clostridium beijerinckii]